MCGPRRGRQAWARVRHTALWGFPHTTGRPRRGTPLGALDMMYSASSRGSEGLRHCRTGWTATFTDTMTCTKRKEGGRDQSRVQSRL